MLRKFDVASIRARLAQAGGGRRDVKSLLRTLAAVLLVANAVGLFLVFRPIGGSPEEQQQQLNTLRAQIRQKAASLAQTRLIAGKVEKGRAEGNNFVNGFFLNDRSAYLTILDELNRVTKESKMKVREHTFASEPIEGSADLSVLTVNGNLEGTYADLMSFISQMDHSKHLIVIEFLQAQPMQTPGTLNVSVRMSTFVREVKQL